MPWTYPCLFGSFFSFFHHKDCKKKAGWKRNDESDERRQRQHGERDGTRLEEGKIIMLKLFFIFQRVTGSKSNPNQARSRDKKEKTFKKTYEKNSIN